MNSRHALRSLISGVLLTIAGAVSAFAEGSFDIPAGAHFNPQKLEQISEFFRNEVATGKIPGAILLIQQHGKPVYHEFFGVRDVATKAPMTDDTIFRLFSMSKPITSVAAMMLIDERQAEARRSRREIHSVVRQRQGRRREEGGERREVP